MVDAVGVSVTAAVQRLLEYPGMIDVAAGAVKALVGGLLGESAVQDWLRTWVGAEVSGLLGGVFG